MKYVLITLYMYYLNNLKTTSAEETSNIVAISNIKETSNAKILWSLSQIWRPLLIATDSCCQNGVAWILWPVKIYSKRLQHFSHMVRPRNRWSLVLIRSLTLSVCSVLAPVCVFQYSLLCIFIACLSFTRLGKQMTGLTAVVRSNRNVRDVMSV